MDTKKEKFQGEEFQEKELSQFEQLLFHLIKHLNGKLIDQFKKKMNADIKDQLKKEQKVNADIKDQLKKQNELLEWFYNNQEEQERLQVEYTRIINTHNQLVVAHENLTRNHELLASEHDKLLREHK